MSRPLVFGVGVNDADYVVSQTRTENGKVTYKCICPVYARWVAILRRCYHAPSRPNSPAYEGCTVSEEWHLFSTFKNWMECQEWQGKEVDKDLLVKGNRVYGPDTCCLVSHSINCLVREASKKRAGLPPGVDYSPGHKKYRSRAHCAITGKRNHLGFFETPSEAHSAWLNFKRAQAEILAKEQIDQRVASALRSLYTA